MEYTIFFLFQQCISISTDEYDKKLSMLQVHDMELTFFVSSICSTKEKSTVVQYYEYMFVKQKRDHLFHFIIQFSFLKNYILYYVTYLHPIHINVGKFIYEYKRAKKYACLLYSIDVATMEIRRRASSNGNILFSLKENFFSLVYIPYTLYIYM